MGAAYHRFIPSHRRRRAIMIYKVSPTRLVRITIPKNDQIREVGQTPASDKARKCQEETKETHHDVVEETMLNNSWNPAKSLISDNCRSNAQSSI